MAKELAKAASQKPVAGNNKRRLENSEDSEITTTDSSETNNNSPVVDKENSDNDLKIEPPVESDSKNTTSEDTIEPINIESNSSNDSTTGSRVSCSHISISSLLIFTQLCNYIQKLCFNMLISFP